jgi:O-antigen ligase
MALYSEKSLLRSGYFYLITALGIGILLTYNRNFWVAAILCLFVLMFLVSMEGKKRLIAMLVVVLMMSVMTVLLFSETSGKFNQTLLSISDRFTSLFAGEKLIKSSSLEIRALEHKYAMENIAEHPVLGIGLGNTYRPTFWRNDSLTYYMENAYLWILTDMGAPGLLFFMLFYIGFLVRAFKSWKAVKDKYYRSVIAGSMISGIGILPMVVVNPIFMQWFSIVVISIIIGLTENIIRANNTEMETI